MLIIHLGFLLIIAVFVSLFYWERARFIKKVRIILDSPILEFEEFCGVAQPICLTETVSQLFSDYDGAVCNRFEPDVPERVPYQLKKKENIFNVV